MIFYEKNSAVYAAEFSQLDLFFYLSCFADSVAYIVELCASYLTVADNFDLSNLRGMQRERLFNAYAISNSSYGECLGNTAVSLGDNRSFEELNSFTRTLDDLVVNYDRVTYFELREFGL